MRHKPRGGWLLACLGLACASLVGPAHLSAEEPKLRVTLKGHGRDVYCLAFSPDGKRLAAGGNELVSLWDVKAGKIQTTFKDCGSVGSVAFSPSGKTLYAGFLWDVETGKKLKDWDDGDIKGVGPTFALSPDGKMVASYFGLAVGRMAITLSDAKTGKTIARFGEESPTNRDNGISTNAFSPDGETLVTGDYQKKIKLWNVKTGKLQATLDGSTDPVHQVVFSPDGKTLAAAYNDDFYREVGGSDHGTIKLWDVKTGKVRTTIVKHGNIVCSLAFSPDGKTLASGSWDKTIKLWDVATGKERATLTGHTDRVYSVAFSPDGKTLASGSGDCTIMLWDIPAAK